MALATLVRSLSFVGLATMASALAATAQNTGYDQPFRPQVHYSPQRNWTNDPNGLVFYKGEYHLFYQYNPFGDTWGHMSWGHAVSGDLLHWRELPVALPEADGTMIFTGSVVVDRRNSSGLCAVGKACLVAVYTGYSGYENGGKNTRQTQDLAYSTDDGRTWTRYKGNPVLDLHMADFRDPSVSWDEKAGHWRMAVSLPKEHKVRFYSSPDLKTWTQLSDFGPMGDVAGDWECPDLLHVPAADGKGPGMWALKVGLNPGALQGGSGEQYFLGSFDGKQFTVSSKPGARQGWTNYGKDDYCAISYNDLPAGARPTLIGWMNNWQYADKVPTSPWRGQFSVARHLSVLSDQAGVALVQQPVIAALHDRHQAVHVSLHSSSPSANLTSTQAPFELQLQFSRAPEEPFGLRLYSDEAHWTEIGYDGAHVYTDRTHAGLPVSTEFPGRVEAPTVPTRPFDLHLIVDRSSVESYAQGGTVAMTDLIFPPGKQVRIQLFSKGAKPLTVSGDLWTLKSIWP